MIKYRIQKVIADLKESYLRLNELVEEIRNYLVDIESHKKRN